MNKKQKEVQQAFLDAEKEVLEQLKKNYQDALDEINTKIAILLGRDDADMSHVMYQVVYQEALKKQVESALNTLQANEFETISDYLAKSYEDGYIGTMYDIQGQGIPIIMPMDQEQVVQAIQHETKLSEGLYKALGKDVKVLSKQIAGEITRGISSGQMYSEIARNIAGYAGISRNKAMRIARTEGHRIQCKATMDAQFKAKEKGADVVKQWDASLDGRTRPTHRKLDGQIRELDEEFEVNGNHAMMPSGFNKASEDINCRCALLQRARWALDESELETLKKRAEYFDLDKAEDFADYKKKYLKAVEADSLSKYTESERIAKSMKYAVDNKVINGRKYIEKFDKMADDVDVRKEYYNVAKDILKHRSGQNGEDLYLYNSKKKRWYKSTSGKEAGTPEYTQEIMDGIKESKKGELVAFHNHPASMPPSADDINSALRNGYIKGYALCHDGKIYEYTASDRIIDISIYNLRIADFQEKGYNEFEAQVKTMEHLAEIYGFEFKEVN